MITLTIQQRARVVAEAVSWLRTPFHHGAQVKRAGVDCAQLVAAVYGAAGVIPAHVAGEIRSEDYPPHWFLHSDDDRLLPWLARVCVRVDEPLPGDLAAFRFGRAVSHLAIVTEPPEVIHVTPESGVLRESVLPTHALGSRLAGYWSPKVWD